MKKIIETSDAPASTSPVAQGTAGGGFVFVGGQMPRDMDTGLIVDGALEQARLSLRHCEKILRAAGSGLDKVTLAIVYVTDLSAKSAINAAFGEAFGANPPARNLVEVKDIGEGAIVEIGVIALA
ncbi:MAG: RidA family protein [Albidovulum sp.]|nr:RidA family protein [Albidovulum sp.]